MSRRAAKPKRKTKRTRRRRRTRRAGGFRARLKRLRKRLPKKRTRQRWRRNWRGLPLVVRWPIVAVVVLALLFVANGAYQVFRKPSELLFPVDTALHKSPRQTWNAYSHLFQRHATDIITADLLAAIAQVEGSGNPAARTYWRWSADGNPFTFYRPASTAVGMFQITDGTFEQSRRYCIRDHKVVADGPWNDWDSCWWNALYTRLIPSHAIELTSVHLDRSVEAALRLNPGPSPSLRVKQELATLIHLCGAGAGRTHARRGLKLSQGQRCGTHDVKRYLEKVAVQRVVFSQLARGE